MSRFSSSLHTPYDFLFSLELTPSLTSRLLILSAQFLKHILPPLKQQLFHSPVSAVLIRLTLSLPLHEQHHYRNPSVNHSLPSTTFHTTSPYLCLPHLHRLVNNQQCHPVTPNLNSLSPFPTRVSHQTVYQPSLLPLSFNRDHHNQLPSQSSQLFPSVLRRLTIIARSSVSFKSFR
ncbi:hypothetical protein RYX36_018365 [Vicia faba]